MQKVPESIEQASYIQLLNLSGNNLTSLPERIGQLSNLVELNLSSNDLTDLPMSLLQLPYLTRIDLRGNANLGLQPELLSAHLTRESGKKGGYSAKDLLSYYFSTRDGRPLNEAKLILVGRGGAGKSSLVDRLLSGKFDSHKPATEGITISHWKISLANHEIVRFNIWDFGGQEIMHATHQFFLTERSLYFRCLADVRKCQSDAEYWLKFQVSATNHL